MFDEAWLAIFNKHGIDKHNFDSSPFEISAEDIKSATSHFKTTGDREVRILCKQDTRDDRPAVFVKRNLFLLPIKNGLYVIIRGEGYVDIPKIPSSTKIYKSKLDFDLDTSKVGNSEMQHLDFAYASSLIRTFLKDDSLVLTIRGRKYTPKFDFRVGKQKITVESVQTEVDAGYEGKKQVVLVEAKRASVNDTIIRQLYYPFRQWQHHTTKQVVTIFFEEDNDTYSFWKFGFKDKTDYNSIQLLNAEKYEIKDSF
jgi:hypothetical protein